jgi:lipopolysaccharide export system protein LptA
MKNVFLIIFYVVMSSCLYAQEDNMIRVLGDSLIGKTIDGENVREVHGNVVMTQGKVRITCEKAIQYIAKNEAELIGNVVVTQDSITIKTILGYYYGNSKIAFSQSGVTYFDGHVNLKSKNGYYYFDEKKAYFYENVILYDSVSSLNSNKLTYYDDEDRAVAVGKVVVKDSSSIILADSLIHFRNLKTSYAYDNVRVIDVPNKLIVASDRLESDRKINYSKMFGSPVLVQIDTANAGKLDTLVIVSKVMEAFGDSAKKIIAMDSVSIVRGDFSSVNNYSIYFQKDKKLFTHKLEGDLKAPVLWNENTQLIGDTINIFLSENKVKEMIINNDASIITNNPDYKFRYDQISGKDIKMFFGEKGLELTHVKGNVLSIYYLYEDGEPNGLLKSSSEEAKMFFKGDSVDNVRLYGNPVSEFQPENLVEGKEKDFTLPTFNIVPGKPEKNDLLKNKEYLIQTLNKYLDADGK